MQMPELDGLGLIQAVRTRYPRVPVILMTAHGSEELAVEALEAKRVATVKHPLYPKPIDALPCMIGALEPSRMTAPFSLPGRSALGITLMQCMQRTHSRLLMVSFRPSQSMQRVGQRRP